MKNTLNLNFKAGQLSKLFNFSLDFDFNSILNPNLPYNHSSDHWDGSEGSGSKNIKEGKLKKYQILVLVMVSRLNSIPLKEVDLKTKVPSIGTFAFMKKMQAIDQNLPKMAFSGIVIQKGELVRKFQIGDEIFGYSDSLKGVSNSNLILEESGKVFPKPQDYTFEESVKILYCEFGRIKLT